MSQGPEILPGSTVSLHLAITLEDGTEAISTFGEEPVQLQMGDGTLQPGLELANAEIAADRENQDREDEAEADSRSSRAAAALCGLAAGRRARGLAGASVRSVPLRR